LRSQCELRAAAVSSRCMLGAAIAASEQRPLAEVGGAGGETKRGFIFPLPSGTIPAEQYATLRSYKTIQR
jgi:hypothetical protein